VAVKPRRRSPPTVDGVGRRRSDRRERTVEQNSVRARARLKWVVEGSPIAMMAVDGRGTIELANALAERLFGYPSGDLVGQRIEALLPERLRQHHARDRAAFSCAPEMRQMGIGRDLFGMRKDGAEVPIEVGLNPVDVDGDVLVLTSVVDITERKRLEADREQLLARFESLIAHAPVAIALFDTELRVISVNDRAAALVGIPKDAHMGRTLTELLPTAGPRAEALLSKVLQTRTPILDIEVGGESPLTPGEARHWIVSYYPVLSHRGDVFAIGAVAQEITERKRAEDERTRLLDRERQARVDADAANRSKDDFVARASHELRTPLNALMGWARMLRDGKLPANKVADAHAVIDRNADVLNTLVEDLVEMSRVGTGTLPLRRQPFDILTVVRESVHLLEPAATAKNIRVEVDLDTAPVTVSGDTTRLRQVWWNLLSNASKFTPSNGRVAVRGRVMGGEVEIAVADTGQGIAAEFLPRVFEPFSRANGGGHEGLGLGLAIVHQLVKAHGGRVNVMSPGIGGGATFTVCLPVVRVPESV
jgi:PAS domain S-box-containing protein